MLLLTSTSDKIQLVTASALNADVHVSWVDISGSTVTPGRTNTLITTATTTDIVAAPAGSTQRNVKTINIRNRDATSSNTMTVKHTDGTNNVELFKATIFKGEELVYVEGTGWRIYDSGGQAVTAAVAVRPGTNDYRLTGVSLVAVMGSDSTSLNTIYCTPFKGNTLALYDGANWQLISPGEFSLAVTGRTTDLPFDVFAYLNSGVATLEFLDWSSSSARATSLARQDGVWVKNGDATRRYMGSVRARSATTFHHVMSGIDLPCKLDLFNADNRIDHLFTLTGSANATYNYTTATVRQAQGSANYQIDVMVGLQEEFWEGILDSTSKNSTISIARTAGIGFDSTTTFSGLVAYTNNTVASINCHGVARFVNQPVVGTHKYCWNEASIATGTCTWVNKDTTVGQNIQSGITGRWCC